MDDVAAHGRLSPEELAESLLFYRRRLAAKLAVAMIYRGWPAKSDLPHDAEDMANAICERLAARETGRPEGYK